MKQVELVVALIGEFAQLDVALGSNIGIMPTPARRGHKGQLGTLLVQQISPVGQVFLFALG